MVVAGLQKNSLIDFPGKISCVVFLSGCNFGCPFCHNPELARGLHPAAISRVQLLDFVEERRDFLEGVVITGGEPTLHGGLSDLCRAFQQKGLAVKLDTNGSRPDVVSKLIREKAVDFIAMDVKTAPGRYGPPLCSAKDAEGIAESIDLIMTGNIPYEFRTTCVRPFVDKPNLEAMGRAISGARQWSLQTFRSTSLLNPEFFNGFSPGFSPEEMTGLQKIAALWVERCTIR